MDYVLAERLVFILGITNLILLSLVLFSCRCLLGSRIKSLLRSRLAFKFYRAHCLFFILFILSVLAHTVLALLIYGRSL